MCLNSTFQQASIASKKYLSLNGRKIIKICEDGGQPTKGVGLEECTCLTLIEIKVSGWKKKTMNVIFQ